jgi:predicted AAA+ superfamily ATPase
MWKRKITTRLLAALSDTPAVLLHGARQTGKSTLVQSIAETAHPALYLTMDNITTLVAVQQDPVGFVQGLRQRNVILDEVQRVAELFLPLKAEIDQERRSGRFLLTGSANALLLPRLADALVGRMEVIELWPLAQCEIEESDCGLVDASFARTPLPVKPFATNRQDVIQRALRGGYPEAVLRANDERRTDWFDAYITTLLQRDVRDLAAIQGLSELPLLLSLLAARATASLNVSDLARSARIPVATLNRYLTLLQATFLVRLVPAWSSNLSSRLVKAPKLLLNDTGVLAYLTGMSELSLETAPTAAGMLLENFVGMELIKLASWSQTRPDLFYFRTHDQKEVDFILQNRSGDVVGIEVKAASAVQESDFRRLHALADLLGTRLVRGLLFYTGDTLLPFGERMYAVPIAALWGSIKPF